jgi:hypothetical protein
MTSRPDTVHTVSLSLRWLPRSWPAVVLFVLIGAVMVLPALVAFFMADVFYTGCFLSCGEPDRTAAVMLAALGVALVLLPFLGVRFYQGAHPDSAGARLAVVLAVTAVPVVFLGYVTGCLGFS